MSCGESCPECGLSYADFRTGLDFADVIGLMWSHDPNPETWRHKRRHSVLGFWRELKLRAFASHVAECTFYAEQERSENAQRAGHPASNPSHAADAVLSAVGAGMMLAALLPQERESTGVELFTLSHGGSVDECGGESCEAP